MRRAFAALALVGLAPLIALGCKPKPKADTDAASLVGLFAPDDAGAAPSASTHEVASASATDDTLPPLKATTTAPPVYAGGKGKPTTTASTAAVADPIQCQVARALCSRNRPECAAKKAECEAAGGKL